MDNNFHYFVTYTAAVKAGLGPNEAQKVAQAARFVDECERTVQSTAALVKNNFSWSLSRSDKDKILEIAAVWPVFHFLPGQGGGAPGGPGGEDEATKEYMELAAKLICQPGSALVGELVEGARARYGDGAADENHKLARLGITLHTLADTFAHKNFSGVPSRAVNEVSSVQKEELEQRFKGTRWVPGIDYSPAFSETSFGYLGHGRIGHLPDMPGAVYSYIPAWHPARKQPGEGECTRIYKQNPWDFYCAYRQMETAVKYITSARGNPPFDPEDFGNPFLTGDEEAVADAMAIMRVFYEAGQDEHLTGRWFGAVTDVDKPEDYQKPGGAFEAAFEVEAEYQRQLVQGSEALRALNTFLMA